MGYPPVMELIIIGIVVVFVGWHLARRVGVGQPPAAQRQAHLASIWDRHSAAERDEQAKLFADNPDGYINSIAEMLSVESGASKGLIRDDLDAAVRPRIQQHLRSMLDQ